MHNVLSCSNSERGALEGDYGTLLTFFQRKMSAVTPKRAGVVRLYITHAHRRYIFQNFPCLRLPPSAYVLFPMKKNNGLILYERWNPIRKAFEEAELKGEDLEIFLIAYQRAQCECDIEDRIAEMKENPEKKYNYD